MARGRDWRRGSVYRPERRRLPIDDAIDLVLRGLIRLGAAAAVLVGGYLVARIARAIVRRLLRRRETAVGPSLTQLASSSIYFVLLGVTLGLSLIALGISPTFVSAITILILVVLVIALRQSVADLAATIIFVIFRPFKRGDLVETMGLMGNVREILLFNTVLLLPDQRLASLPNSKIQAGGIVNYTRMGRVRVDFNLTVGYDEDLERIRRIVTEVASSDDRIMDSPPFQIVTEELTDLGVRLRVLPTVAPGDYWGVRTDLREQIKARFDAEGIRFAVPPRDVTVRREER